MEELDKKLLVQLRDGRKIIGILRSFDQFANLVLESAIERIIVETKYAEVPLGLYVVRGENVVLLGQIDDAKDPPYLLQVHSCSHATMKSPMMMQQIVIDEQLVRNKLIEGLSHPEHTQSPRDQAVELVKGSP